METTLLPQMILFGNFFFSKNMVRFKNQLFLNGRLASPPHLRYLGAKLPRVKPSRCKTREKYFKVKNIYTVLSFKAANGFQLTVSVSC